MTLCEGDTPIMLALMAVELHFEFIIPLTTYNFTKQEIVDANEHCLLFLPNHSEYAPPKCPSPNPIIAH